MSRRSLIAISKGSMPSMRNGYLHFSWHPVLIVPGDDLDFVAESKNLKAIIKIISKRRRSVLSIPF
ncbi:MAG TPA: hypothetical protein PL118_07245 [Rectinema sp.]|nr:hypothetical protein [Spirochaetota bacterium]NLH88780.1 hypothetical protein [Treponema sp.]HNV37154.1 hypothetical protein [Rectinema sp.]HOI99403.1 hypothetical protein [Rectinema sp.]HPB61915.1 hypothetical protein [Rectinema sp.]